MSALAHEVRGATAGRNGTLHVCVGRHKYKWEGLWVKKFNTEGQNPLQVPSALGKWTLFYFPQTGRRRTHLLISEWAGLVSTLATKRYYPWPCDVRGIPKQGHPGITARFINKLGDDERQKKKTAIRKDAIFAVTTEVHGRRSVAEPVLA